MEQKQKDALCGSVLIQQLMKDVNGAAYSGEARIWNASSQNMRLMLWNLANLNHLENNTNFKQDWLKIPNHLKAELREAIYELYKFTKQANLCFSGGKNV